MKEKDGKMILLRNFWRIRNLVTIIVVMFALLITFGNGNTDLALAESPVVEGYNVPSSISEDVGASTMAVGVELPGTIFGLALATTFSQPTAPYLGSTTQIDISSLGFGSQQGSIGDGFQTVTFKASMQKLGPVPSGWATWGSPPDTETRTPHVLYTNRRNSMALIFSQPTSIVGFELEPNSFSTFQFTASFYSGSCAGTLEGSITRSVVGRAGARLFAAQTSGGLIDCVSISVVGNPFGFSIAQVRYAANQPPDCSQAATDPSFIWPPNHKMVHINVLGVSDPDGDPVSITVDSIFQDEPTDTNGDGKFAPDGQGIGTDTAEVRAERAGTKKVPGNGRMYHIGYTAVDGNGGSCSGEVLVGVPHNQGGDPIDEGALYDSTVE